MQSYIKIGSNSREIQNKNLVLFFYFDRNGLRLLCYRKVFLAYLPSRCPSTLIIC